MNANERDMTANTNLFNKADKTLSITAQKVTIISHEEAIRLKAPAHSEQSKSKENLKNAS